MSAHLGQTNGRVDGRWDPHVHVDGLGYAFGRHVAAEHLGSGRVWWGCGEGMVRAWCAGVADCVVRAYEGV